MGGTATIDDFTANCRRHGYNSAYDRLQHLIMNGLITSEEYFCQLKQLKSEYSELFDHANKKEE